MTEDCEVKTIIKCAIITCIAWLCGYITISTLFTVSFRQVKAVIIQCLSVSCLPPSSAPLRLLLVLTLGGCGEVIEDALHELKGGSVLSSVLPAAQHHVVQLCGTVVGLRHPVAALYGRDHLPLRHP